MSSGIDPKVILSLPPSVLEKLPGGIPPPGVSSNFVDPPTLRSQTIAVGSVFFGIAVLFSLLRLYVKVFIIKKVALDDAAFWLGFAFSAILYSGIMLSVTQGAGGRHMWDSTVAELLAQPNIIANWLTTTFVTPALGFVKLTFLIQYYQMFWPLRWVRLGVWIGGGASMVFYIAVTIVMFVLCSPWPNESWVESLLSEHFYTASKFSIPTGTIGAAIDLFLLILPIRAVSTLKLPTSKKIGLIFVFLTGTLASVASFVGLAYRVINQRDVADAEWGVAHVWIWLQVELFAGLACACMPMASKLISHHGGSMAGVSLPSSFGASRLWGYFSLRSGGKPSAASKSSSSGEKPLR